MQSRWSFKRRSTWALVAAPALAMAGLTIAAAGPAAAHGTAMPHSTVTAHTQYAAAEHFTVKPNKVNMVDCNGWSKLYTSAAPGFRARCTDPRGPKRYTAGYNTRAGGAYSGAPMTTSPPVEDAAQAPGHHADG